MMIKIMGFRSSQATTSRPALTRVNPIIHATTIIVSTPVIIIITIIDCTAVIIAINFPLIITKSIKMLAESALESG